VTEALSQNTAVIGEQATKVAQAGFATLSGLYARVAGTLETAARQQGMALDLGSRSAASVATSRPAASAPSASAASHASRTAGSAGFSGFDDGEGAKADTVQPSRSGVAGY
jgi:hypothetical protein